MEENLVESFTPLVPTWIDEEPPVPTGTDGKVAAISQEEMAFIEKSIRKDSHISEEKKVQDITLEDRSLDRAKVLKEIRESPTFRLQKLYFTAQSTYDKEIDSFLGGSWPDLQIEEYLQDIENFEQDVKLDDAEIKVLQDVKEKSQKALDLARNFSSIVMERDLLKKHVYKNDSITKIQKVLQDLPVGEKVLIPAGYFQGECYDKDGFLKGEVTGHTVELEFTKTETKDKKIEYICTVFNTGAGSNHHTVKDSDILPAVYTISSDSIDTVVEELCRFSSLAKTKESTAMKDFYAVLEKRGKRDLEKEKQFRAYELQAVGNCTQKSYDVWLQQQCSTKDGLYEKFSAHRAKSILQESEKFVSEPSISIEHQMIREDEVPLQQTRDKVDRCVTPFFTGISFMKTYKCEELKIKGMLRNLLIKNCAADLSFVRKYVPLFIDDKTFLLDVIEQNPEAIQQLCPEKMKDREFVLTAVKRNGLCLQYLSDEMKNDELIVFLAVDQNWRALDYAASPLRDNKAFCFLALSQDEKAAPYATSTVRNDAIFMRRIKNIVVNIATNLSTELKKNKDVALALVAKDGGALYYLAAEVKQEREVVFKAVKQSGLALLGIGKSSPFNKDEEIVLTAITNYPTVFKDVIDEMKSNEKVALEAVKKDGMLLKHYVFGSDKEKNKRIALAAVKQDGLALQYVPKEERDVDIIKAAVEQNKKANKYVGS